MEPILLAAFDKCPGCGSEKSLMRTLVERQVKEGKTGKETVPGLYVFNAVAMGPKDQVLIGSMVPCGIAIIDMCLDCGMLWGTKAFEGQAVAQTMPVQPGMVPPGGN